MDKMTECPICGCLHNGADDICEDCIRRINATVRRIQAARDALISDMVYDAAGGNIRLAEIIEEGLRNETT